MFPVLFHFRSVTLYTYGFFVALAVLISYFLARSRAKTLGLDPSVAADFTFYLFAVGVIGARLFYVIQHHEDYSGNWWGALSIREGGLVWYGGFIVAAIVGLSTAVWKRWPMLTWCDWLAPLLPLAHGIGRLGCFFNGCCYGRVTRSGLGVIFPGEDVPRFPSQLFEALGLFMISGFLFLLTGKKRREGELFIAYLMSYSVFRFFMEFLRGDQNVLWRLTPPQWTSVLLFFGAIFLFFMIRHVPKQKAP